MQHTLSIKGYSKFDADSSKRAIEDAQELIASYNKGEFVYVYTTNQSKPVEEHKIMKVWHIMSGSGIFFIHKITKDRKRPERIRVRISMSQQLQEYWDSDDEPTAKVETADPPQSESHNGSEPRTL
jgi:hypothetical protein